MENRREEESGRLEKREEREEVEGKNKNKRQKGENVGK